MKEWRRKNERSKWGGTHNHDQFDLLVNYRRLPWLYVYCSIVLWLRLIWESRGEEARYIYRRGCFVKIRDKGVTKLETSVQTPLWSSESKTKKSDVQSSTIDLWSPFHSGLYTQRVWRATWKRRNEMTVIEKRVPWYFQAHINTFSNLRT